MNRLQSIYSQFHQQFGLARSFLIYYGLPGRQRRLRRFYSRWIRPGDLCFDLGAHVGNRILAWRALGARVVAVEPQPNLMAWLRRLYGHSPQVSLVEAAVGARPGEQILHMSSHHPTVTTLSQTWIEAVTRVESFAGVRWDRTETVSVTTLDALIAHYGRPAFCKIDVEGYELEVLRGLSTPLPALSFEYIPAAMAIALGGIERLESLGPCRYNWTRGETPRFVADGWLTAGEMAAQLARLTRQDRSGDIYACPV